MKERAAENPSGWGGLKLTSSYINGRLDDAADAVVLEPLDVEAEDVVEVGEEIFENIWKYLKIFENI